MKEKNNLGNNLGLLFLVIIPTVLVILGLIFSYNGLVSKEENVFSAWSQVESNFQRRADLIPNLVKTVKEFAKQEKEVILGATKSRAQLQSSLSKLESSQAEISGMMAEAKTRLADQQFMQKLTNKQQLLGTGLKNIFAVTENYPNLRSSDNFLALQSQLEGTENRINVARMSFNEGVKEFNGALRRFPGNILAGAASFSRKAYFKSATGSNQVTTVDF